MPKSCRCCSETHHRLRYSLVKASAHMSHICRGMMMNDLMLVRRRLRRLMVQRCWTILFNNNNNKQ